MRSVVFGLKNRRRRRRNSFISRGFVMYRTAALFVKCAKLLCLLFKLFSRAITTCGIKEISFNILNWLNYSKDVDFLKDAVIKTLKFGKLLLSFVFFLRSNDIEGNYCLTEKQWRYQWNPAGPELISIVFGHWGFVIGIPNQEKGLWDIKLGWSQNISFSNICMFVTERLN